MDAFSQQDDHPDPPQQKWAWIVGLFVAGLTLTLPLVAIIQLPLSHLEESRPDNLQRTAPTSVVSRPRK